MDSTQEGVEGTLLSERDISEGFDRLIAANRLFGAELNPLQIRRANETIGHELGFHLIRLNADKACGERSAG